MAEQAYAYVTLIPVAKGFKNSIEKELGGVAGVGGAVGQQAGNKFAGGFGGAIKGLAVTVGGALAAAGVGRFLSDSIKSASNLGESVNAVNKAYGDFAADVLALGGDVANRLGLSTVDFNAAAVRFSAFAEKIAGQGGNVAGVVDSLTTRAADFASVFNIDVSEALAVFQSGLSGEAEPLKRFGINLLDSEVKAFAYANGIAKVGAELTEAEKVQARYGLLLETTSKTAGDFADTSDGLANSQRILAANIENLRARVGEGLTPIMATFTSALVPLANVIFPAIAEFLNTYIAPGLQRAADAFKAFATSAGEGGMTLSNIFDNLKEFITNFLAGDGVQQIFQRMADFRTEFFDSMMKALPGIIDAFIEFLPKIFAFLYNDLLPGLIKELTNIVIELAQLLTVILPKLVTALLSYMPELLKAAMKLFESLIQAVIVIAPALLKALVDLLPQITKSILTMLPDILKAAIELFTAIVNAIPKIIPPLISAIIDLLPVIIDSILDMLPQLIDAAFKLFTGIVSGLLQATPQIISALIGLIPKMVDALMQAVPRLIQAGFEVVSGFVKGILENAPRLVGEAAASIANTLVNGVKSFLGIKSPSQVFYDFGVNVGQGFINGMRVMFNGVEATAEQLAALAAEPTAKTLKALGIETTYSNYGVPNILRTKSGAMFDVGRATDDLNAIFTYMGAKTAEEMAEIERSIFGGSFQQALDVLFGQTSLENPFTGQRRTIGGDPEGIKAVMDGMSDSFYWNVVDPLEKSTEELIEVFANLSKAVTENGFVPAGVLPPGGMGGGGGGGPSLMAMATGGYVDGPTPALVGEAGPEVVMPLDRFEKMMGLTEASGKTLNYYAAPNQSLDSEQELFKAMRRAKVVASW